ncbi:MAG: Ig-like domain-containing protein [Microbacteriaceae bacterium]
MGFLAFVAAVILIALPTDSAAAASPASAPITPTQSAADAHSAAQPAASGRPIQPPTITNPAAGAFIGSGSVTVSGTRDAAGEIQVFSPGGTDPDCVISAERGTRWSCAKVALPSGTGVVIRIAQLVPGAPTQYASIRVDSLTPPAISTGPESTLLTNGPIHGTGLPGARIMVTTAAGSHCAFDADATGAWACVLGPVVSGSTTATAVQSAVLGGQPRTSDPSAAARLTIDVEPPGPPTMTSPEKSTTVPTGQRVTFAGGGDDGNLVTVYAGAATGSFLLCQATVAAGSWSCLGAAVADGTYHVVALQRDAAGNVSGPTNGVSLLFAGPNSVTVPPATSSATPAPGASAPVVPPDRAPGNLPPPARDAPGPAAGAPGAPGAPAWTGSTPFTTAVQSGFGAESLPGWLRSGILAFACLLLLLLPARLLGDSIAAVRAAAGHRGAGLVLGRNRHGPEFETSPVLPIPSRLVSGGAGLVVAAAVIALAVPVGSYWSYLRLFAAVVVGLVLVNTAATVVPLLTASRTPLLRRTITFAPRCLLVVAVATLASRLLGLQPALLFALIFVLGAPAGARVADRGRLAAIQVACLLGLGTTAWLLLGLQSTPAGAVAAFWGELGNIVVLASVGSAALSLIPIGRTPGRAIYAWSRSLWLGISAAVFTVLFAVLIPVTSAWQRGPAAEATGAVIGAIVGGFAIVSFSVWLWQRFVAPALR